MHREYEYVMNWQGFSFWLGVAALVGVFFGAKPALAVIGGSLLFSWALALID